jgi:hypothetical protein
MKYRHMELLCHYAKSWVHHCAVEKGDDLRRIRDRLAIGGSFSVNDFNFRDRPRFSILLSSLSLELARYSS